MNKLKGENLRRALSHIERHKQAINTSNNSEDNDFHKILLRTESFCSGCSLLIVLTSELEVKAVFPCIYLFELYYT